MESEKNKIFGEKKSLKARLIKVMMLLAILQSLSLIMVLNIFNLFGKLDDIAFLELESTVKSRADNFHSDAVRIMNNSVNQSMAMSEIFWETSERYNIPMNEIYTNDSVYEEAVLRVVGEMTTMLNYNEVTGAFFILNNIDEDAESHPSVYIRNLTPDMFATRTNEYVLQLGCSAISKRTDTIMSDNWALELEIDKNNMEQYDYYTKPIESAMSTNGEIDSIEQHGYWSTPLSIADNDKHTIIYTLPIIDDNMECFGVIGVEIELDYFAKYYLPNSDLAEYENSFFSIVKSNEEEILFEKSLISDYLDYHKYLENIEVDANFKTVPITPISDDGLYTATLAGVGEFYCNKLPINMYNDDSIFKNDEWSIVALVPYDAIHKNSQEFKELFFLNLGAITMISFVAIVLLVHLSTGKISKLSAYVKKLSPYEVLAFQKTDMTEIDELTNAIVVMNQKAVESAKMIEYIIQTTELDLGGYEITSYKGEKLVITTEYITRLLGLKPQEQIPEEDWKKYFKEFTKEKSEDRENIYKYNFNGEDIWLKIIESEVDGRFLGVISDVTKVMNETIEMQKALDYDQLTELYNRDAYKRKVNEVIEKEPDKIGAMLFIDLDNLKYMNDTFGHEMGDKLITSSARLFDRFTKHNGKVARISGDEFSIYIHGFNSKDEIRDLIKKEQYEFTKFMLEKPDGTSQKIGYSAGIAWYPENSDNSVELLKKSDFAMYQAKHNEKGATYEFSQELYDKKKEQEKD